MGRRFDSTYSVALLASLSSLFENQYEDGLLRSLLGLHFAAVVLCVRIAKGCVYGVMELSVNLLYVLRHLDRHPVHQYSSWCRCAVPLRGAAYMSTIHVKAVTHSLQVLLNIVNFSKTKSLYREGLAPVVCSRRRPQWNVSLRRKNDTIPSTG